MSFKGVAATPLEIDSNNQVNGFKVTKLAGSEDPPYDFPFSDTSPFNVSNYNLPVQKA